MGQFVEIFPSIEGFADAEVIPGETLVHTVLDSMARDEDFSGRTIKTHELHEEGLSLGRRGRYDVHCTQDIDGVDILIIADKEMDIPLPQEGKIIWQHVSPNAPLKIRLDRHTHTLPLVEFFADPRQLAVNPDAEPLGVRRCLVYYENLSAAKPPFPVVTGTP